MSDAIGIPLGSKKYPGMVATIDAEDYGLVSSYHWRVERDQTTSYAVAWGEGRKRITMHSLIAGSVDGKTVDHKDRNGLNNRRSNLRHATPRQQSGNRMRPPWAKSPYRGIRSTKNGRWTAQIVRDNRYIHLGTHDTPEDAARAYDTEARSQYGDFATLNFPD